MVGIGLIGAGIIAKEAHVPALIENKANVVAIYSRSIKSASGLVDTIKETGGSTSPIEVYSDEKPDHGLDELLARVDVHAVIIMLPILIQPNIVRKCLAAGKHVLCEKPIAKDVATGEALIKEYETTYAPRNLVFSVAEQYRYHLAFTRAQELVANGEIGDLKHVHARIWGNIQPGSHKYYETAWRKEPGYQGGFLLDGGVHFVSVMRKIAGQEIVETTSFSTQVHPYLPPADTVNAALRFSGGAVGSLSISFASAKRVFEFIFIGSKGSLTVTHADRPSTDTKLTLETLDQKDVKEEIIAGKAIFEEIKAFLSAAESGKRDTNGDPKEALADVAVIESICAGGGLMAVM